MGDRFELLGELGRGGMGVVYRARDLQADREVALKVALQVATREQVTRFTREAELTARLQHPGIVRVHSSGLREGRPYIAYELVDGQSLDLVLDGLPRERRVELIRDAARALGHAHRAGVFHRDVKPANILVGRDGAVRVADFGLATAQDLERLTQTGAIVGTPSYMAPEQIGGKQGTPGPPSDVWSLGVTLYQALTGELPFEGPVVELLGAILSGSAARPSAHDPSIPRGLEEICLRCLRVEPAQRFPDGGALADALDAWLAGEWTPEPRRWPWALVPLGLALLALGGWWTTRTAPAPAPEHERERERAPREAPRPTLSKAKVVEGDAALRDLEQRSPRSRAKRAREWLERYQGHPRAAQAQALLRSALLRFPQTTLTHAESPLGVKAFWVDARRLLTQGGDNRVLLWDLDAPDAPLLELAGNRANWSNVDASVDGRWALLPRGGSRALAVDLETQEQHAFDGLKVGGDNVVRYLTASPDGEHVVVSTTSSGLYVYSWPERRLVCQIDRGWPRDLAFSADGQRLFVGGGGWQDLKKPNAAPPYPNYLCSYAIPSGELLQHIPRDTPPTALALGPDRRRLVVGDGIGRVFHLPLDDLTADPVAFRAGDATMGTAQFEMLGAHSGQVRGVCFNGRGDALFSVNEITGGQRGMGYNELRVWAWPSGEQLRKVVLPHALTSAQASPDGKWVAVGTNAGVVELWRAEAR